MMKWFILAVAIFLIATACSSGIAPGVYAVGEDIEPGIYIAIEGDGPCAVEFRSDLGMVMGGRLGLKGMLVEITSAVVEVRFLSCTWELVE